MSWQHVVDNTKIFLEPLETGHRLRHRHNILSFFTFLLLSEIKGF